MAKNMAKKNLDQQKHFLDEQMTTQERKVPKDKVRARESLTEIGYNRNRHQTKIFYRSCQSSWK